MVEVAAWFTITFGKFLEQWNGPCDNETRYGNSATGRRHKVRQPKKEGILSIQCFIKLDCEDIQMHRSNKTLGSH
jgi:hypothetical protein